MEQQYENSTCKINPPVGFATRFSGFSFVSRGVAAIIAELPAGNYTAIVRSVNNTTGVALVEVYDLGQ
jgi:hypothetical protein